MTDDNKIENSIIPIGSTGIVRVGNSIDITNKIIKEHEERRVAENFKTVKIGNQYWMTKNLDVDCYLNGDSIPQIQNPKDWENLKTGAWCYYNNDPANNATYGKLYNWYAVAGIHDNDPNTPNKILAPDGWHVPSDTEWTILTDYLGGLDVAGGKMKATGTSLWQSPNTGATNESGFSALPAGQNFGGFVNQGFVGYWWSSSIDTTLGSTISHSRRISNNYPGIGLGGSSFNIGISVRLVKD